jgi:hypothetical protein
VKRHLLIDCCHMSAVSTGTKSRTVGGSQKMTSPVFLTTLEGHISAVHSLWQLCE